MSHVKPYKAWFISALSLQEIGEFLVQSNDMADFEYDYEDTYEWIEGNALNEFSKLNIWRKLGEEDYWDNEPVVIYAMYDDAEPADEAIESIARRIAEGLGHKVFLGQVRNLLAENYEFSESISI